MRALLASLMLLTLIPQAHASEVRNYFTPQLGGHRIHACLSDGACGKAAADAFCKIEGYDEAMLFQRGLNSGISHNPLESITNDDTELCVRAFQNLLQNLATENP